MSLYYKLYIQVIEGVNEIMFQKNSDKLKSAYKMQGFKFFMKKSLCYLTPKISKKSSRVIWIEKCTLYLSKYVDSDVNKYFSLYSTEKFQTKKNERPIIWILWLQGKHNMPLLVQKCYESVCSHCSDYDIRLLSQDDLNTYIQMPDYIEEQYRRETIPIAQYSDLVRICLLEQYGGLWLDATVLLTGTLPQYINNSDLFFYQSSNLYDEGLKLSNWLIQVKYPFNPIISALKDSLFRYWKVESHLIDNFVFHMMVNSLLLYKLFKCEWDKIPYSCNATSHIMQFSLLDSFSTEAWKSITCQTSVHKLTWKLKNQSIPADSMLSHILYESK
jgi:hypothetical protein